MCRDCNDIYATKMRFSKYCLPCRDKRAPHRWRRGHVVQEVWYYF